MAREVLKVEVQGLDPYLRRLKQVEKRSKRKAILRASMQAGTNPLKKELRNQIKTAGAVRKGNLRKAVASVVRVYRSGVCVIMTGIRYRKLADGENPGNYFHLVDLGVKPHMQNTRPVYIEDIDDYRQIPGESLHPGHYGEIMKYKAERKAWPKVAPAVMEKFDQGLRKALTRG